MIHEIKLLIFIIPLYFQGKFFFNQTLALNKEKTNSFFYHIRSSLFCRPLRLITDYKYHLFEIDMHVQLNIKRQFFVFVLLSQVFHCSMATARKNV